MLGYLIPDECQPDTGTDDKSRRYGEIEVDLHCGFFLVLRLGFSSERLVPLGEEDFPHRKEVEQDNNRRVPAEPAQGHRKELAADKDGKGDHQHQHQAEPSGQSVGRTNCSQDRTVLVSHVKESQVEQVEGISPEQVPYGQVGGINHDYGAYPIEKFRQRCNHSDNDKPNPHPSQAALFGDDVPVFGNLSPREKDNHYADDEFDPDQAASPYFLLKPLYGHWRKMSIVAVLGQIAL
ncbi:hypothetical protein ES703_94312 [subsurface metagenome]